MGERGTGAPVSHTDGTGAAPGPINWKCKNGWTQLTKESVSAIQVAVSSSFVQICFDEEKAAVDALS